MSEKKCSICEETAVIDFDSHGAKGPLCQRCADKITEQGCPECEVAYVQGARCE